MMMTAILAIIFTRLLSLRSLLMIFLLSMKVLNSASVAEDTILKPDNVVTTTKTTAAAAAATNTNVTATADDQQMTTVSNSHADTEQQKQTKQCQNSTTITESQSPPDNGKLIAVTIIAVVFVAISSVTLAWRGVSCLREEDQRRYGGPNSIPVPDPHEVLEALAQVEGFDGGGGEVAVGGTTSDGYYQSSSTVSSSYWGGRPSSNQLEHDRETTSTYFTTTGSSELAGSGSSSTIEMAPMRQRIVNRDAATTSGGGGRVALPSISEAGSGSAGASTTEHGYAYSAVSSQGGVDTAGSGGGYSGYSLPQPHGNNNRQNQVIGASIDVTADGYSPLHFR